MGDDDKQDQTGGGTPVKTPPAGDAGAGVPSGPADPTGQPEPVKEEPVVPAAETPIPGATSDPVPVVEEKKEEEQAGGGDTGGTPPPTT